MDLLVFILFLAVVGLASAVCPGSLKSYTCQCSAWYSKDKDDHLFPNGTEILVEANLQKFFSIPDYEYCSNTLDCDLWTDCAKRCHIQVLAKLGATQGDVTDKVKDDMCDMLAPNQQPLYYRGIRVYSFWKFDKCSGGQDIVIKNLCCNRRCACSIHKQDAGSSFPTLSLIGSLKMPVYKSFECSRSDDDPCPQVCRTEVAIYLGSQEIAAPFDENRLTLNAFRSKDTRSRMCALLNEDLPTPGTDVTIRIESGPASRLEVVRLGRVCCRKERSCDCSLTVRGFNEVHQMPGAPIYYPLLRADSPFEEAYECSSHQVDCMKQCRDAALRFAKGNVALSQTELDETIDLIDPVRNSDFNQFVCKHFIQGSVPNSELSELDDLAQDYERGVFIYLAYNSAYLGAFSAREELYLGKICCLHVDDYGLIAKRRCVDP